MLLQYDFLKRVSSGAFFVAFDDRMHILIRYYITRKDTNKKMKKLSSNTRGSAHLIILVGAVVGVAVLGTLVMVIKANHHKSVSAVTTSSKTASNASSLKTPNDSTASTASPVATTSTTSTSSIAKTSTKTPTTPSSTPATSPASSTPAAQTPLSVLTTIIANLQSGSAEADVTANSVTVPGPISNAQARPIVFSVNGQTYFAYTQTTAPNFNLTAAQTASTMAVVKATVSSPALVKAYLDKTNNLTDANFHSDGFSTGGN